MLPVLDFCPMAHLVECVPNFSEGRRPEVIDDLAQAVAASSEVFLLDKTMDRDHNRSVLTFAGPATPVTEAMEAAVAIAIERIDLNTHQGQHPRIGAVDVIPFVPLGETTMEDCIELARAFGHRVADRFGLPVFLYAKAAQRPDRVVLADIRRPQFEGLRDQITLPDHGPDFGPARVHPTAGAVAVAIERIDLNAHQGQHPRIGAVDVIPFVPLGETTMEDCIELARAFSQRIADRFDLPVFLYAKAAQRPDRVVLADIRRPQFEGLRDQITLPDRGPDFGPARLHPTAGAVAVGARPFLIAYNINLESANVDVAKRIAKLVRESSGGLPRVQALGLYLDDLGVAQVSMNLLDHTVTPIWRVWEAVGDAARAEGVELRESELIGLCPLAALVDVADHVGGPAEAADEERITEAAHWLRIRDFDPMMALELRLAAAQTAD